MDPLLGACSLTALRQRRSHKWRAYPPDVLPAFVAEMDFDLAEPVIAAVTSALAIGDGGYAHMGELPDAFAQFAAQRLGWTVEPSRVFPIPDVMTGLAEVVQALTPPGSGIVVNPPVYPPFRFRFGFYGRRLIDAPLARGADGRYALDPDAIEAALSEPGAATYLLCSPHNPTGNVWSPADLAMVADACQRHGAMLLVDEIHAPLALNGAPEFGAEGRGFVRLNMGTSPELLEEVVRRVASALLGRGGGVGASRAGCTGGAQHVTGQFHLPEVLGDLLEHVQQRMPLRGELQFVQLLLMRGPATGRPGEVGRGGVGAELAERLVRRGSKIRHRAVGVELGGAVPNYLTSRDYFSAPEFHYAKAMPQDRIRRIRSRQCRFPVSQIIAETGDNFRHPVHSTVHVTHRCVR